MLFCRGCWSLLFPQRYRDLTSFPFSITFCALMIPLRFPFPRLFPVLVLCQMVCRFLSLYSPSLYAVSLLLISWTLRLTTTRTLWQLCEWDSKPCYLSFLFACDCIMYVYILREPFVHPTVNRFFFFFRDLPLHGRLLIISSISITY